MNNESVNLWEVLAGVAVFMLGMRFLEDSLQTMAGRSFKLFLKRNTSGRFRAVAGGTIVTAVLQSSSVVNLLVLAFVGASLLTMQNALAVILGANLGTTISNWVIATVGFSYQISDFAYPLTGVAGILAALSTKGSRLHHWSMFLLGFSFIFLG
ncbi:MAG: Na/Pi cotransporter family protein, partial [Sphingobacteriales bacterium]